MAIFFQDRLAISARLDSISYAHCITKYLLLVHREAQYINAAAKAKALEKFIPKQLRRKPQTICLASNGMG